MTRSIFPVVVALAAVGCSEYNVSDRPEPGLGPAPVIKVSPSALQYGELSEGDEEVQTFTVENIGDADLNVADIQVVDGAASFTILSATRAFLLAPGDSTSIDVAFTPMGVENFGRVHVLSDDPETPEAPVDLLGFGAVPELAISPEHWTFNAVVPCGDFVELTLENVGSEVLTITDADYASGGLLTLDAGNLTLPLSLAPGETRAVTVHFSAVEVGSDFGELSVTSNDPRGVVTADQNGEGSFVQEATEAFTEPGIPPVDVMFLIDQSCSMEEDNKDDIQNGIPGFISTLQTVADWQLVQITKHDACANGGIMDSSTPNASNLLINNAFTGTGGGLGGAYLTEQLLKLASNALAQTGPGQCNAGFLRPGALLHIIVASDEKEQSGTNWSNWLADYRTYVSAPDLVKVSAIADFNKNCGDGSGAGGYEDIALATGGSLLNICSANWGAQLTDIAADVLAGIRTYNLSDPAIEGTIEVTVNGVATTDFSYTPGANSVTIDNPPIDEGDEVEITYGVMAECN